MYKVVLKGFPTEKEARIFCEWFEGQGEQDATYWFEAHNQDNEGRSPMTITPLDITKPEKDILEIEIEML